MQQWLLRVSGAFNSFTLFILLHVQVYHARLNRVWKNDDSVSCHVQGCLVIFPSPFFFLSVCYFQEHLRNLPFASLFSSLQLHRFDSSDERKYSSSSGYCQKSSLTAFSGTARRNYLTSSLSANLILSRLHRQPHSQIALQNSEQDSSNQ